MILKTLFGSREQLAAAPGPLDDYWYHPVGAPVSSGVRVDEMSALSYSAWWAGINVYGQALGSLPLILYRRRKSGGKDRATDHPLYHLLHSAPNREQTSITYRETKQAHVLCWGNCYSEIETDRAGRAVAMWPLNPDRVKPRRGESGRVEYAVKRGLTAEDMLHSDDIFHVPGLGYDGIKGYSVVRLARQVIGLGLGSERYGATYFGNGAKPSGLLKHPGKLKEEARVNLRESWERLHQGPDNAHRVAILEEGMDWIQQSFPPEESQFLQTRQFQVQEVARILNLPPHMLRDLMQSTNNNIEQQSRDFLTYSLRYWLVKWEQEISRKLLRPSEQENYFAEFLVDDLLRGDMLTRFQAYAIARQWGWASANDVRERENQNQLPDAQGDIYMIPVNMVPASSLVKSAEGAAPAPGAGQDGEVEPTEPVAPPPVSAGQTDGTLLDVPDFRQSFDYDCGAAASHSVAAYYAVGPETEEEWIALLGTKPTSEEEAGTTPGAIIGTMVKLGLSVVSGSNWTVEDLTAWWKKGWPVICPIQDYGTEAEEAVDQSGHYVVVIGVGMGQVFIQDPSHDNVLIQDADSDDTPGRGMISEAIWLEKWHDVGSDGTPYVRFGIAVGQELPEPPGDEEEEPVTPDPETIEAGETDPDEAPEGKPANPETPAPGQLRAMRGVLVEVLARLGRKEANAVRRAAGKPKQFLSWLDEFYREHAAILESALQPAAAACAAMAGLPCSSAHKAAGEWARMSHRLLLETAGSPPDRFAAVVDDLLVQWESTRPAEMADQILAKTDGLGP